MEQNEYPVTDSSFFYFAFYFSMLQTFPESWAALLNRRTSVRLPELSCQDRRLAASA